MKKSLSIVAAVALAALGGVVVLGASPQAAPPAQEESKTDKQIKALTEKVDKLEKRVAELEKKLAERSAGGFEERLHKLLDKFGGGFDGDGLKKKLDEFRRSMPELPDFESMPDLFGQFDLEGLDMDQLLEMLKSQFDGQMPEFFDGLDLDGLFNQFKEKIEPRKSPAPEEKKAPKRRSI